MPRAPNDPYDTSRSNFRDDPRDTRFERDAQVDPQLSEGGASSAKVTLVALGIAIVLGVVFYGLNSSSVHEASMAPPAQTAKTQPANPNNQPGTTTGAATNRPAPPQASPKGPQSNQSANPGQTK